MPDITANPNSHPERYSRTAFRFLEILPGATVWLTLILPFLLAFIAPEAVTTFILVFDLYWLTKALTFAYILIRGYRILTKTSHTNWHHELERLPVNQKLDQPDWHTIYHAVILTTYKEEIKILETSIDSMISAHYPKQNLIFILATEERDAENARIIAGELKKKYAHHFYDFLVTEHPDGVVGEVKAKGANAAWAAKQLVQRMEEKGINPNQVMVSTADADTRFHPQYFNRLTYLYLANPGRLHCSFQPVAMYLNNIWDAPMMSRILAFGTTFWQLIESIRDYRLITFSTHAMSLQTLIDLDFWDTTIVNEDSRQFFRGFFAYEGNFRVIPMFLPVYMDAVHVGSFRHSLKNLYLQQQRWAYGVEHFPYIVLESLHHPKIPAFDRFALAWRAFEGMFSWATASYFITIVGWLPILLNRSYKTEVIALNFQLITRDILLLTWIGLFLSAYITFKLLPARPSHKNKMSTFTMTVQWVVVPIAAIMFGSLPAIDAQTRLMLGKYIGFRVTEKARLKPSPAS